MRSRYTAFALGDADHLRRSWHPSTRPRTVDIEEGLVWTRLLILGREAGGPFDNSGVVEFEAFWRHGDQRGSLRERSRFVREERRWSYLDGEIA